MRAKLGTAQAITATAHKIARILYHAFNRSVSGVKPAVASIS
jgi:hypothetical protein